MSKYPDYVHRKLLQARDIGQYSSAQADGAAICFDLLADFPDCVEASETIYELFCDEWTIYDNRVALQRLVDEWDDQPYQQRRRLAQSFAYMSRLRWAQDDDEVEQTLEDVPFDDEDAPLTRAESAETKHLLHEGKMQLLEAYCLGDEEAAEYAWPCFIRAMEIACDSQRIRLAVAKQYADMGFFADAVEILLEYLSNGDSRAARRLLAEVRWWRDNAHRIPWIPPPGDGSRYNRLIKLIDADAPTMQETLAYHRAHLKEIERVPTWAPVISPELKALFSEALPNEQERPTPTLVDWSFLDQEDGTSTEIAEWVNRQIRMLGRFGKEIQADTLQRHKLTRPIPPPKIPRKYDPNEIRMSGEEINEEEFWDELDAELGDGEQEDDDDEIPL